MKVAICLSGHLRNYEKTISGFIDNLVKPNKADVFIHTWDERLQPTSAWWNKGGDLALVSDFCTDGNQNPPIDIPAVKEAYSPQKILVEKRIDFASDRLKTYQKEVLGDSNDIKVWNVKSMWYGITRSHKLIEEYENKHGFKYDAIIRCRPDLIINEPLDISKHDLKAGWFAMQRHYKGTGCCDIIFFSNRENMKYMCGLGDRFEDFFVGSDEFAKHWGSAERVFRCYIEASIKKFSIKDFTVEKTFSLLRVSGSTINFGT